MCSISKLTTFNRGNKLAVVTPIYKTEYYYIYYHMKILNICVPLKMALILAF